ncbi:Uncharacterised protein [Segatella buccae]|uniref:Uncharacterized protein n=1 Tax=Segatella buccae TaxID=28126 RepID=A0AAQ1UGY9_9BACT|nr:Uncharacterised protein [Segatella buccae]
MMTIKKKTHIFSLSEYIRLHKIREWKLTDYLIKSTLRFKKSLRAAPFNMPF